MYVTILTHSTQEQYWRIPADMTPTQLDEAVQALQQSTDCHDNSVDDQPEDVTLDTAPHTGQHDDTTFNTQEGDGDTHSGGGDIQDCAHDDTTLVDDTPNGLPDDDDGNHSDSSNNGLCIDYQSDAETEGLSVCVCACAHAHLLFIHHHMYILTYYQVTFH